MKKQLGFTFLLIFFVWGAFASDLVSSVVNPERVMLIPHVTEDALWDTFLVLENTSQDSSVVYITLYNQGNEVDTMELTVESMEQESFQLTAGTCGTVTTNSPRISAKAVYRHRTQQGIAEIQLTSRPSRELHLLFSGEQVNSISWQGFTLMNPSSVEAHVVLDAYVADGSMVDSVPLNLPAYSRCVQDVSSLFPKTDQVVISRVKVVSDVALDGLVISGDENRRLLFSKAQSVPKSGIFVITHVATQKEQWKNTLIFNNVSVKTVELKLVCYGPEVEKEQMITIPAGETLVLEPESISAQVECGFIESSSRDCFIRQRYEHRESGNMAEFVLSHVTSRALAMNWPETLEDEMAWKGLAIFNPSGKDTQVQVKAIVQGKAEYETTIYIDAESRFVGTLDQLFSHVIDVPVTRLEVFSKTPVSAIQISGKHTGQLLFCQAVLSNYSPVHVTFFSHNEDSWGPMVSTVDAYRKYREDLLDRLDVLSSYGAALNWQSDWPVLLAMAEHEHGDMLEETNGKNIARYMVEDLGYSVDPHGHLTRYSYADLAHLIKQLGVNPSGVIGGMRIVECSSGPEAFQFVDWKEDISLGTDGYVHGNVFPDVIWKPTILSCPAYAGHWFDDYSSGVWKPGAGESFYHVDQESDIAYIGQGYPHDTTNIGISDERSVECFASDGAYIKEMVSKIKAGEVALDRMMTASLHIRDIGYINKTQTDVLEGLSHILGELEPMAAVGDLVYVTYQEARSIWEQEYQEEAFIVPINTFSMYDQIMGQATSNCRSNPVHALFSINVHDWTQPEESKNTLNRILDIHEKNGVYVDVYLTDSIARIYERSYPELIQRLKASPVVAMSYHIRPPSPYYWNYDFLGLPSYSEANLSQLLTSYETHGIDLETGMPRPEGLGGVALMNDLFGSAPLAIGGYSINSPAGQALQDIYNQSGSTFIVIHGEDAIDLGEKEDNTFVRPEHIEIKIYEHERDNAEAVIRDALAQEQGSGEWVMNIKVHENNFYTVQTPWWPVFYEDVQKTTPKEPPFNLNAWKEHLQVRSEESAEARWRVYEEAVVFIASNKFSFNTINCQHLKEKLQE